MMVLLTMTLAMTKAMIILHMILKSVVRLMLTNVLIAAGDGVRVAKYQQGKNPFS